MSKLKTYRVIRIIEEIFETAAESLEEAKAHISEHGNPHSVTIITEDWQVKK